VSKRASPATKTDSLGREYTLKTFTCQQCGDKFQAIHGNAKYCPATLKNCRLEAHKERHRGGK